MQWLQYRWQCLNVQGCYMDDRDGQQRVTALTDEEIIWNADMEREHPALRVARASAPEHHQHSDQAASSHEATPQASGTIPRRPPPSPSKQRLPMRPFGWPTQLNQRGRARIQHRFQLHRPQGSDPRRLRPQPPAFTSFRRCPKPGRFPRLFQAHRSMLSFLLGAATRRPPRA